MVAAAQTPNGIEEGSSSLEDIRIVVTDMDGTLLDQHHDITPETEHLYGALVRSGRYTVLPATGRCRSSADFAMRSSFRRSIQREVDEGLRERLSDDEMEKAIDARLEAMGYRGYPSVFMNGMVAYGPNGDVVFQRLFDNKVATDIIEFVKKVSDQTSLFVNCGDFIYIDDTTGRADAFLVEWLEGNPVRVPDLAKFTSENTDIYRVYLVTDTDEEISRVRKALEEFIAANRTVDVELTSAVPLELEVLPRGASKSEGLKHLLPLLNGKPEKMFAIGDGENDRDMLEMAAVSVAMGNAVPSTKKVAKFTTKSNAENGWAEAMRRHLAI